MDKKSFDGLRVMLVDDERMNTGLYQEYLITQGASVDVFNNPAKALSRFEANYTDYDVVITDMIMPDISGVDLAEKMRAICPPIPIVLCTGYIPDDDERLDRANLNGILTKPVGLEELHEVLSKIMTN